MKYKELIEQHSFVEFLITSLLSKKTDCSKTLYNSVKVSGNINMDFKINDITIDPMEFFARLEQAFDYEVKKKAQELITEKFSDMQSVYEDYCNLRKELDKKVCKELNIEIEEW